MHFLGRWRKIGLIFRTMQMEDLIAWFSSYEHLGRAMWLPPWSFLSLAALGLWLYLSRFHRGNIGLALCTGIAIVKTIQTLH
jgi:hypothetical protein